MDLQITPTPFQEQALKVPESFNVALLGGFLRPKVGSS
jgi:hypothetical protein